MLLLRSSLTFMFMGYAIPHSEAIRGSIGIEQNPPIWNCRRSVQNYIPRYGSSYPHPRLSLLAESECEAIASASYMGIRRAPLTRRGKWSFRMCLTRDELIEPESTESGSLIGLNTFMASHPSLDEVSKSDITGLENPVENSISTQQIQIQSESHSVSTLTLQPLPLGSNLISMQGEELEEANPQVPNSNIISMQGEELEGANPQVPNSNISELVNSFVETLHEKYPLVTGKNEDYKHSTLELGPNGVPLFCTARGCRVAHVCESDYNITEGSGNERKGGNCAAADDENSKSSRDMYYQSMLEADPGNSLLLSNYAKFLHQVQHDIGKAEEYYGRAILASPDNAEILSLYAKFTCETHNDAARAEAYFDRAVKAAPDDCYVLSSYAHFLWNSEEEEQTNGPVDLQNVATATCIGSVTSSA